MNKNHMIAWVLAGTLSVGCTSSASPDDGETEALMAFTEWGEALCEARASCDCPTPPPTSVEDCVGGFVDLQMSGYETSLARGLHRDSSCLEAYVDSQVSGDLCDPTRASLPLCDNPALCSLFYGDAIAGAPCSLLGGVDTSCDQGLACLLGVCIETCGIAPGGSCGRISDGNCTADHYCSDEVCTPFVGPGEPCVSRARRCNRRQYCSRVSNTCVDQPGLGERCDERQCLLGAMCDETDPSAPVCVPLEDALIGACLL